MITRYLLLAIFGIAMAHVEGVVVVYLRKALGLIDAETDSAGLLEEVPKRYVKIEMTREVATIVMLVALALLVGENRLDVLMVFLWTFAFWDLFYYLSLYLVIKWPPKLTTMDVLFLIPRPWIAPVWLPIGISTLMIIIIAVFYL
ncbi:hypothetical protein [Gaoshiqia sediminis]|uniref:Uncharacterized protein n=1 Tax=Gaoshiqia sediminis TaxID=2986998 RepID=A0AA42C8K8_9BACT|nr:hypothetical protein [Gaoshiqia sediminis]MCW0481337.1 hypothetical protein [Gaoshiqia sediminis]